MVDTLNKATSVFYFLVGITNSFLGVNSYLDVDIKVPPKPKPRRSIGHLTRPVGTPVGNSNSAKRPISVDVSVGAFCPVNHASPIQRSNLTDLTKEKTVDGSVKMETPPFDKSPISRIERSTKYPELSRRSKGYSLCDNFISDNPAIGQSTLFFGKPGGYPSSKLVVCCFYDFTVVKFSSRLTKYKM